MKRVGLLLATGALVFGSAASAWAQAAPPPFTVTFNGQFRMMAGASNNVADFVDTKADGKGGSTYKDSGHNFSQRYRLWTNVTSGDKKAGAVWAVEVGDIFWGTGGGAANGEGNGSNGSIGSLSGGRSGNGAGGALGADGVNVETKHAYAWFDIPGMDNARVTVGIQNVGFLWQPQEFFSDDAAAIKFTWKSDPVSLELWYARFGDQEGPRQQSVNSQHDDAYTARVWIKPLPDWTFSVEGMLRNQQCFSRQIAATTNSVATVVNGVVTPVTSTGFARTGPCLKADIGDTFWIGGTVSGTVAGISIDGGIVYGQKALAGAQDAAKLKYSESGFGIDVAAKIPINPVSVTVQAWYTSGDSNRTAGDNSNPQGAGKFQPTANGKSASSCKNTFNTNGCFTNPSSGGGIGANNSGLVKDSDRLPSPDFEGSWYTRPLIAEILLGMQTIGGPPESTSTNYAEKLGTYGIGANAMLAILPNLTVGGGVAYVGASDADGLWGSGVIELDGGVFYTLNANLTIQAVAGVLFPDKGDTAWGGAVRTMFSF